MKKITNFIVNKRNFILVTFLLISGVCLFLIPKVNINYDLAAYLPKTSQTRIGMDIMESDFKEMESSSFNIMFENLTAEEKNRIYEKLSTIENVSSVSYDASEAYNKGEYTLYVIHVAATEDSKTAKEVYNTITKYFAEEKIETSGPIAERNKPVLHLWIILTAILFAMIILILMCDSYIEPFLFLFVIGLAVVLNYGTNIFFSNVSNITNSICAILQMALSMDYSIMLMNRYTQEKEKEKNKVEAMKKALYKAISSISSSSVTTIVGLLALVFMSFTIGRDLGFVLAKGVLLSLVCILLCLPALILIFDSLITKTKKKSIPFNLAKLGKFSFKVRYPAIVLFFILFVGSFLVKGNLGILYTGSEADKIGEIFQENNQMAIIYNNQYEEEIAKYCKELENKNKVDQILCYGNTIHEKLTYTQLNSKLSDLGQDVDIEEDLLKMIYYHYYNQSQNLKMTFNELLTFIDHKLETNEMLKENIDQDTKDNLELLRNFVTSENQNRPRTTAQIANILGVEEEQVKDLFVLYHSKNISIKLPINTLMNFLTMDVFPNPTYARYLNADMIGELNKLRPFMNKDTITKKMNSQSMASVFGMDESMVNQLYLYSSMQQEITTKMSFHEFADFVLKDIIPKREYAFDEATLTKLNLLQMFSDSAFINQNYNYSQFASIFHQEEDIMKQLFLLYYLNQESTSSFRISDFINQVAFIKNNTELLKDTDVSSILQLSIFTQNNGEQNTIPFDKNALKNVFGKTIVDLVYSGANLGDEVTMTTFEFSNLILNNFSTYLDQETLNKITLIHLVIQDSLHPNKTVYKADDLANLLNTDSKVIHQLYTLIDYVNKIENWQIRPDAFVDFILKNQDNALLSTSLNEDVLQNLEFLQAIMAATNANQTFTYQELASHLSMPIETVKSIYALQSYANTTQSPFEFVNFILNHQKEEVLKNSLNEETLKELTLLKTLMSGILEDTTYSASDIAKLFGINKEEVAVLYALYDSKINSNQTISLKEFVNFLLQDVVTNSTYRELIDENSIHKLNTVLEIMNCSLNNTKYTSEEIVGLLNRLASKKIDSSIMDVLYIYYGSEKSYSDAYSLTIEEFINYLNEDVLKDKSFHSFISEDMEKTVEEAKESIQDAKDLLVSKKYSRAILNTKFDLEGKETFDFIKNIQDQFNGKEDIYVIGDSPMAYDMSKSFNDELNYITILTMLAIFIVVAITFKSIIIPFLLVLIIQCAVFITMGILSLMGGEVYFISLLIVQSILMGATIDYAILYTSYYKEFRNQYAVKDSLIHAYNKSIHTILTSASILIIVTLIVGNFASAIAAKICKTLSQGTFCSLLLVLFILPPILAACDKWIIRKNKDI